MKTLKWFINKRLFIKDETQKRLVASFIRKSRTNIITMELLSKAMNNKEILDLPKDYDSSEWVVVSAYYSMYVATLALLARIGYRSKNHTATSLALYEFFVKKELVGEEYLELLEATKLQKEEIEQLNKVRERREIAQYSATKETGRQLAEQTKKDAHKFVDKIEEVINEL